MQKALYGHSTLLCTSLCLVGRHPRRSLQTKCLIFGGAWILQIEFHFPATLRCSLSKINSMMLKNALLTVYIPLWLNFHISLSSCTFKRRIFWILQTVLALKRSLSISLIFPISCFMINKITNWAIGGGGMRCESCDSSLTKADSKHL